MHGVFLVAEFTRRQLQLCGYYRYICCQRRSFRLHYHFFVGRQNVHADGGTEEAPAQWIKKNAINHRAQLRSIVSITFARLQVGEGCPVKSVHLICNGIRVAKIQCLIQYGKLLTNMLYLTISILNRDDSFYVTLHIPIEHSANPSQEKMTFWHPKGSSLVCIDWRVDLGTRQHLLPKIIICALGGDRVRRLVWWLESARCRSMRYAV